MTAIYAKHCFGLLLLLNRTLGRCEWWKVYVLYVAVKHRVSRKSSFSCVGTSTPVPTDNHFSSFFSWSVRSLSPEGKPESLYPFISKQYSHKENGYGVPIPGNTRSGSSFGAYFHRGTLYVPVKETFEKAVKCYLRYLLTLIRNTAHLISYITEIFGFYWAQIVECFITASIRSTGFFCKKVTPIRLFHFLPGILAKNCPKMLPRNTYN